MPLQSKNVFRPPYRDFLYITLADSITVEPRTLLDALFGVYTPNILHLRVYIYYIILGLREFFS